MQIASLMRKTLTRFFVLFLLFTGLHVPLQASSIVEKIGDPLQPITVIYLKGSPYEMGFIHGSTLAPEIHAMYDSLLKSVSAYGSLTLLDIAYRQMEPFIPKAYQEEMRGLADGAGISLQDVHRVHAIPDVSELNCTFFAAWGKATADGNLVQIRALDYATDWHLQEHPALLVCEPDSGYRFVNVGWVGFVGIVSGMNDKGLAVSEIGESFDKVHQTLAAEPMPFVLRDVLQYAAHLDSATHLIAQAHRTSSFLYCVGDANLPEARSFKTSPTVCDVYSDSTSPTPFLENVVYFSMGTTSHWNNDVYHFLQPHLGTIDVETAKNLMRTLKTGSLHAVVYDPSHREMWVANAGIDRTPAYKRTFWKYDLAHADSVFAHYNTTPVISEKQNSPSKLNLLQNYPNPFNPETKITFTIPIRNNQSVDLSVFSVTGQKIATLAKGKLPAGNYLRSWSGKTDTGMPVSSGIYVFRLTVGNISITKRALLIR